MPNPDFNPNGTISLVDQQTGKISRGVLKPHITFPESIDDFVWRPAFQGEQVKIGNLVAECWDSTPTIEVKMNQDFVDNSLHQDSWN